MRPWFGDGEKAGTFEYEEGCLGHRGPAPSVSKSPPFPLGPRGPTHLRLKGSRRARVASRRPGVRPSSSPAVVCLCGPWRRSVGAPQDGAMYLSSTRPRGRSSLRTRARSEPRPPSESVDNHARVVRAFEEPDGEGSCDAAVPIFRASHPVRLRHPGAARLRHAAGRTTAGPSPGLSRPGHGACAPCWRRHPAAGDRPLPARDGAGRLRHRDPQRGLPRRGELRLRCS
jgi:hypothetical protein